jgi:ABC-type antimicrobial peptide transport system permease subunit
VKLGGLPYTVVGITESQGKAFGISFDNFVIAPWRSPARRFLNIRPNIVDAIAIQSPANRR